MLLQSSPFIWEGKWAQISKVFGEFGGPDSSYGEPITPTTDLLWWDSIQWCGPPHKWAAGPTSVFGEKESTISRKICELHLHVSVKSDPCSHCEPGPSQNLTLMQLSPCLNLSFFFQILSSYFTILFIRWWAQQQFSGQLHYLFLDFSYGNSICWKFLTNNINSIPAKELVLWSVTLGMRSCSFCLFSLSVIVNFIKKMREATKYIHTTKANTTFQNTITYLSICEASKRQHLRAFMKLRHKVL